MNFGWKHGLGLFVICFLISGLFITGCSRKSKNNNNDPDPPVSGATQPADPPANDPPTVLDPFAENVLTYHNNNARTGAYLHETLLTPRNVNSASFGKVGFLEVRGLVDAEPL